MSEKLIIAETELTTTIRPRGGNQDVVIQRTLPILPIRNIVVFPGTVMPLNVGRPKSKALLDEVMPGDKIIGVCNPAQPRHRRSAGPRSAAHRRHLHDPEAL